MTLSIKPANQNSADLIQSVIKEVLQILHAWMRSHWESVIRDKKIVFLKSWQIWRRERLWKAA